MKSPRISIVTASFNQARFIRETIESVLAQGYADVEHIVVDGRSTDDTPLILDDYPHLKVVREPDRGQADAINKGFRLATGDVFAFLNSDDTLLPGALERVAAEIDPARGRHVVMGRCRFVDENGRFHRRRAPERLRGPYRRAPDLERPQHSAAGRLLHPRGVGEERANGPGGAPGARLRPLLPDEPGFTRSIRSTRSSPLTGCTPTRRRRASTTRSASRSRCRVSRKYWGPWLTTHGVGGWRRLISPSASTADAVPCDWLARREKPGVRAAFSTAWYPRSPAPPPARTSFSTRSSCRSCVRRSAVGKDGFCPCGSGAPAPPGDGGLARVPRDSRRRMGGSGDRNDHRGPSG